MKNKHLYSPHWRERIRPAILRRDNYKCTVCGATNHSMGYYDARDHFVPCDAFMVSWAQKNGIRLTTVHLQVAHIDQNPANNDENNLKTFCPRHHLAYDRQFNTIMRKAKRG